MEVKKILVPTDFSDCAKAALEQALFLAREHGAELYLLHVVALHGEDPNHPDSHFPETEALFRGFEAKASDEMKKLLAETDASPVKIHHENVRAIAPGPAIVEYAARQEIDLAVLGSHGRRGIRRFLLGSVTEEVVRTLGCPMITVRGDQDSKPRMFRNILVPYDFSDDSAYALATAVELAGRHEGKIDLVHVVSPAPTPAAVAGIPVPGMIGAELTKDLEKMLKEHADAITRTGGPQVTPRILEGPTELMLVDFADEHGSDVIVMGSHGLTGVWHFLLGSVTEKVVRTAHCPVWVQRIQRPAEKKEAETVSEPTTVG